MFHGVATGRLRLRGHEFDVHLHDVETLNRMALSGVYDVTKLSFHAWLLVAEMYEMLGAGAALGYGCGPVVVSRGPLAPADLPRCRVAVPGELTTAHMLLRLWRPDVTDKVFVRYDEVMPMLAAGQADAGVIIHEGRFTYERAGFHLLADLGQWWHDTTGLPIPLGCIAAKKELGAEMISDIERLLRRGIAESIAQPDRTVEYVRRHAQEMDEAVLKAHIRTFVNDYSLDIGDEGRRAVEKLRELARGAGIIQ
jgi:1,4-dihydroxy-6-naphthoate synthase